MSDGESDSGAFGQAGLMVFGYSLLEKKNVSKKSASKVNYRVSPELACPPNSCLECFGAAIICQLWLHKFREWTASLTNKTINKFLKTNGTRFFGISNFNAWSLKKIAMKFFKFF